MRCLPCTCAPEVGSSPETPNWEGGRVVIRIQKRFGCYPFLSAGGLGDKIYELEVGIADDSITR